jgi:predicted RNA binding protein YcfA (HicA-like mRNA interferase family)
MSLTITQVLATLKIYDIRPDESLELSDINLPAIGQVKESEIYYPMSLDDILDDNFSMEEALNGNVKGIISDWANEIENLTSSKESQITERVIKKLDSPPRLTSTKICAWYRPIHYFGSGWGIYIRESCILDMAKELACWIDLGSLKISKVYMCEQLYKAAFLVLYLHEHFHHKVESFGFRLLMSAGEDKYFKYKENVYKKTHGQSTCLEETLANAYCYKKLKKKSANKLLPEIQSGLLEYLEEEFFANQPPGYKEAIHYLKDKEFEGALFKLQSQIQEGDLNPIMPNSRWLVANNMMRPLWNIGKNIYMIIPDGTRPLHSRDMMSYQTTSSKIMISSLKKYGWTGNKKKGKGSHTRFFKDGFKPITVPQANILDKKVTENILKAMGGYKLSQLQDVLSGKLR